MFSLFQLKTTYGDVTFDIVGEIWNNDTDGEVKLLSRCSEMSKEGAYGGKYQYYNFKFGFKIILGFLFR